MIELTRQPIDSHRLLESVNSPLAGANLLFLGTTRQFTGSIETVRLDYDAYEAMAMAELQRLHDEAMQRWSLVACSIVHRLGIVEPAEASVGIAVSSPHRAESFASATWLLETLKKSVPIWKREHGIAGDANWVHPGSG